MINKTGQGDNQLSIIKRKQRSEKQTNERQLNSQLQLNISINTVSIERNSIRYSAAVVRLRAHTKNP